MYIYADHIDGQYIDQFLPADLDEKIIDRLIFIELELSNIGKGQLAPDPKRGLRLALAYYQDGEPIILIGNKEYPELDGWEELMRSRNVAFCKRSELSEESLSMAIRKITTKKSFS
jgi:hypothetical protein